MTKHALAMLAAWIEREAPPNIIALWRELLREMGK